MKDTAVKSMFETIARGYDFQNSFLSLGVDIYWRKALAAALHLPDRSLVLDVAIGTAEVALEICRHHPGARVIGIDFSPAMLAVARPKIQARRLDGRIGLAAGDGRRLPIRSASVNAVTIAFGIRNIEEKHMVLQEFYRVLKPGGQLLVMEFSYPDGPLLGRMYRFYADHVLPPVGNWLSGTDYAYSYLADSVEKFPADPRFLRAMGEAGFTGLEVKKLTFGIAKIFSGVKESR
jgi:demethylmenaquinone methyltransferase/2-methoxy-6-polyprenyl-1,4-benzoquinol methylase